MEVREFKVSSVTYCLSIAQLPRVSLLLFCTWFPLPSDLLGVCHEGSRVCEPAETKEKAAE